MSMLVFVVSGLWASLAGARLPAHEAPRATDLLRAQRAAAEARRRLELPAARGRGWVRGGEGFEAPDRAAAGAPVKEEVHIHLGGPKRRKATPP